MSDALLNLILFVPIGGLVSSVLRRGPARTALLGGLFSFAIETLQWFALPGRNPSVGDLVFNTLGAAVGALLVRQAGRIWGRKEVPRAVLPSAIGLMLVGWTTTGFLLEPSYTRADWFGQWTPRLGHLAPYQGTVESAALSGFPLADDVLPEELRRELAEDFNVDVVFRAGEPTPRLASILSIYDRDQEQILLFGVDGTDVVFRYRRRADDVALDVPDVRWRDAAAFVVGERVAVNLSGDARSLCLTVQAEAPRCSATNDLGWGWSLLMYPAWLPYDWRTPLGILWIFGTGAFVGVFVTSNREALLAGMTLAAALVVIPLLATIPPTPGILFVGLLAGLSSGAVSGQGLRWLMRPSSGPDGARPAWPISRTGPVA